MKNNWGTYIGITYTIFAASMIFMLLRSCGQSSPLIEENYYEKELELGNLKSYIKNTHIQKVTPAFIEDKEQVIWQFKNENAIKGSLHYKHLANPQYDRTFDIRLDSNLIFKMPKSELKNGDYQVEIFWNDSKDSFYFKNQISL